ncbi:unnamed protein product [Rotaria sordida]|uniref:Lipase domain-containing protein n=1 Tax=Rotaria sordida TaxID=392033 RepID=A0A814V0K6_9BILA|nr:unnamed protein product [Rotaria sordida]
MIENNGTKAADFHVIDHSLGSYIAGCAGKRVVGLGRISGLDPTGPYFENTDPAVRLDPTDALFVDVIHTDGAHNLLLGLGSLQRMGHVDFFPNDGVDQPNCSRTPGKILNLILQLGTMNIEGFLVTSLCSHLAAVYFFTDSIRNQCPYVGYSCPNFDDFNSGKCSLQCDDKTHQCNRMGYWTSPNGGRGDLYLKTQAANAFPYCINHYQITLQAISATFDDGDTTFARNSVVTRFIPLTVNIGESNIIDGHSLTEQASNGDQNAIQAFQIFAQRLGNFLVPYIEKFKTDLIVIGGGIAQAWYFIENDLNITLKKSCNVQVYFSLSYEKTICLGAVQQQLSILFKSKNKFIRQTCQNLLPVIKTINTNHYDLYPCHEIPIGNIGIGYKQLNEEIFRLIEIHKILLIDGFVGTYFDEYAYELNKYYNEKIKKKNLSSLIFYDTRTFLKIDINNKQKLYLQYSKSIFGKLANNLNFKDDFIDLNKLNYLKNNLSYPCVIIGPGASFINQTSPLIYIDLTKNELYYRILAQTSFSYLKPIETNQEDNSLKSNNDNDDDYELSSVMYEKKCLYFLDYPIFNKLKQELLPRMTIYVDSQRPHCPTWIHGHTFNQALAYLTNVPIRVRPWFEAGSWGGQWLKSICKNISQLSKNYAWSYEMITPENGIILSDENNHLLEFSWDLFYSSQANRILGNDKHYRLFGGSNDFPIRFDFLDTMDGGNLSIQCHPNLQYMRTNFGEKITQDETYYIVETKQHWKEEYKNDEKLSAHVYLGFHDNINPEEFHQALLSSRREHKKLNVEKYIQCIPSNIHDFFLIPNETIHASGQNQVVLEISATPYIYTFKLYDWLRLDLDDRLRPLNIEHGMKNLKFNRRGEQLRCQPITMKFEQDKYEEQHLPTHNLHFYDLQRLIIEPNESIEIIRSTENRFHLCMLVEGDTIEIEFNTIDNNQQKQIRQYNYIETFLIPASINQYRLRPIIKNKTNEKKPRQFILLIAYLKWDCEKLLE